MKKILIIQTAFLGDVILATPLVEELKRLFPEAEVDVLVKKGNEGLLAYHPKIRQVYVFDKTQGKFKNMLSLIQTFRQRNYDLTINLHRFFSSGLITIFSGAKEKVGFRKNPLSLFYNKRFPHILDGRHEVERNLSLIQHLGAVKKTRPRLYLTIENLEKVAPFQKIDYYCLAPASVWFTKQLPKEKWIELIKQLPKPCNIYLVGGKGDYELCESIKELSLTPNVFNLAGELNLLQSAALFEKAKWNYVNDSGPLHLCSAVNANVTAFFCSTVTTFGFSPLSDNAEVAQIEEDLYCRPCGLHGFKTCPEGHFRCGKDINVEKIIH